jgi:hypothetical protein
LPIEYLSDWHEFDRNNLNTYPEVSARIQVKYADGRLGDLDSLALFFLDRLNVDSPVVAWRYIRSRARK